MRILEDHQHRTGAGQSFHLSGECLQRSLPALLRSELDRGIASVVRQRQHRGKEGSVLRRCRGLFEQPIKFIEFFSGCVLTQQSSSAFDLADERVKRTVSMLRGAGIAQAYVRLTGKKS